MVEIDRGHQRIAREALAVSSREVQGRLEIERGIRRFAEQGRQLSDQRVSCQSQLNSSAVRVR